MNPLHFPWQIQISGTSVYLHIIAEYIAFFIGVRYYYFLKKRTTDVISSSNRLWIMLGAMIGALLGSRIIAAFEVKDFFHNFSWLAFYGGKTVLGGFLGGLFGVEITKKIIGEKHSSGDLYVLPMILALFIGRIGCFSMGTFEPTHGIETSFVTGMDLGDGKMRHPVMLYEMAFLACLFVYFKWFLRHLPKNYQSGDAFKLFMLLYFGFRFIMEFLKPHYGIWLGLTIIQWCGIFLYLYYWKFILKFFTSKTQHYV